MNLVDANRLAYTLVARHLPGMGYRIDWTNARNAAGQCIYAKRTLRFSVPIIKAMSEEEATDTILHEIAHALTPGFKHGPVWVRKHRELGGSGNRTWANEEIEAKVSKWVLTCQNCGVKAYRNRLAKGYFEKGCWHPSCGKEKGQMTITANR